MAKTADVQKAIWTDPWFLALPPDAKLLYLWAISTEHGNLAGLFVCAQPVIQMETGLTPARLEKALEPVDGKLHYRAESGALWIVGRAKNVRCKTKQIAKGMANAVAECPEPDFQVAFVEKYGQEKWLAELLGDLALPERSVEPHPNLTEVPSRSRSRSRSQLDEDDERQGVARPRARVAGTAVSDDEHELAEQILDAFNAAARTGYTLERWLTPIVGRIREWPAYTAEQHAAIVRANFKSPWWTDRPGPNVLYGNGAAFERAIEAGRANTRRPDQPQGALARDLAGVSGVEAA